MAEKSASRARKTRAQNTTTPAAPTAPEATRAATPDPVATQPASTPSKGRRAKANGAPAPAKAQARAEVAAKPRRAAKPGASATRKTAAPKAPAAPKSAKAPARKKAAVEPVIPAPPTHQPAPMAPRAEPEPAALSVLIVSSEARPFSPPGTLGEYVGALPAALGALGHRVTLVVPKYAGVEAPAAPVDRFEVALGDSVEEATCYELSLGANARVILLEHPRFFEREHVYGPEDEDYPDNPRRFAFLSKAALEFASREGERVDVVQSYDWQTGLVPVYLRTSYANVPSLSGARSVFTIHDIAFQGLCDAGWLGALGLGDELFSVEGLEYWGQLSLLKGGVNFADVVSAARRDTAEHLRTPGGGAGFEGIIAARGDAFRGALPAVNGDAAEDGSWTPAGLAHRLVELYGETVSAPQAHH